MSLKLSVCVFIYFDIEQTLSDNNIISDTISSENQSVFEYLYEKNA